MKRLIETGSMTSIKRVKRLLIEKVERIFYPEMSQCARIAIIVYK